MRAGHSAFATASKTAGRSENDGSARSVAMATPATDAPIRLDVREMPSYAVVTRM